MSICRGGITLKSDSGGSLALKEYFKEHTPQTAKEAVDHIQKTYSISYSTIGVTKLLHRLGFVYKKPKVIPAKADREKQEAFIAMYKQTKEQLGVTDGLYFLDATHPTHNTTLSYGWILKGKANDKFVKTTSGRKRLNLNGALNINDKTAIVLEEKTINTDATIHLLEAIRKKQKKGKVYMILDNASHHHAKLVRRWILHHPRFTLLFLPACSPNLNLIEGFGDSFIRKLLTTVTLKHLESLRRRHWHFSKTSISTKGSLHLF